MKKDVFTVLISAILLFAVLSLFSFAFNSDSKQNQLKVTLDHPFLIQGKWINAEDLQVGDELTSIDGKKARITNIEEVVNDVRVYNIEDEKFHNYVVGDNELGIVVHNSNQILLDTVYRIVTNLREIREDILGFVKTYFARDYDQAIRLGKEPTQQNIAKKILSEDPNFNMPNGKTLRFPSSTANPIKLTSTLAFETELAKAASGLPKYDNKPFVEWTRIASTGELGRLELVRYYRDVLNNVPEGRGVVIAVEKAHFDVYSRYLGTNIIRDDSLVFRLPGWNDGLWKFENGIYYRKVTGIIDGKPAEGWLEYVIGIIKDPGQAAEDFTNKYCFPVY